MQNDSLVLSIADAGEDCLVTCSGDLDVSSACRFRESVDAVVALHPERVYLDCESVAFIDPDGISAVMHVALACRSRGIMLTVGASDWLRRILDSVGVGSLITLRS
ncbi:MAG TPA: STAS domain-containing protein [Actinomycetota bacterium]|nr:STAS domain-containing protein [Actinomycetota bacterium]